jgi:putative endonuclease
MANNSSGTWFVYLLECRNGRLYTGITTDLFARFQKHLSGKGAMFTRINRPSHMVAATCCRNRSEASKIEAAVKKLASPASKRAFTTSWEISSKLPSAANV